MWGTPTLLVNKKLWSYHKVVLDLWWAGIWLKVSIVYQFHEAKSRYLSSEPGHWFKKQLSKFSWNQSKDLTFAQIFAFCDLNVIFDNSNWIECVYILKFQIGVNSKADHCSNYFLTLISAVRKKYCSSCLLINSMFYGSVDNGFFAFMNVCQWWYLYSNGIFRKWKKLIDSSRMYFCVGQCHIHNNVHKNQAAKPPST